MRNFNFYNPVRIIFGSGEFANAGTLAAELGKKVCTVSYKNHGFMDSVLDTLNSRLDDAGLAVVEFFEIEENPDIATVADGVALCRAEAVDCIIGIGGGSVMDAAKAIAAGVHYDGDLWNMVYSRHDDVKAVPPETALPMLMIPTLPATGSEMNMCSVVSNRAIKEKSYIWSECLFPKMAILDPDLTLSLPPYQSACAAADAISHSLEIYINGQTETPLQHYFQEGVIRTTMENILPVLENPGDGDARANLMWAATCAINGFANPGDAWTPIHQVAHNLTSLHGIPHGASLSMLMSAWMMTFWSRKPEQYKRFAVRIMDVNPAGKSDEAVITEGIAAFKAFLKTIGVPTSLSEGNIAATDFDAIIAGVVKVSFGQDGMLAGNPPVSQDDIRQMLTNAL